MVTKLSPGEVVLLNFPFSSKETQPFKKRPVLVLGVDGAGDDQAVVVAMVTSRAMRFQNPGPGDVRLTEWANAGLDRESTVRTRRFWSAEPRDVIRNLGTVDGETLALVREKVVATVRAPALDPHHENQNTQAATGTAAQEPVAEHS